MGAPDYDGRPGVGILARLSAGLDGRREPVAIVLGLLAAGLGVVGVRSDSHTRVALALGLLLLARGVALGRPLLRSHLAACCVLLVTARLMSL